jgi:hypothetical protein
MTPDEIEAAKLQLERDKFEAEKLFRGRELTIREREQDRSRWSNPLVIAVIGATLAALSNAGATFLNGYQQRTLEEARAKASRDLESERSDALLKLEESKSEATRILEMIKTSNADKAAENLQFLIDTGLLSEQTRLARLRQYLQTRPAGAGPTLPAAQSTPAQAPRIDRDLAKLHPTFRQKVVATLKQAQDAGLKIDVIEGYRSPQAQAQHFQQGRGPGPTITMARPWGTLRQFGFAVSFAKREGNSWSFSFSSQELAQMKAMAEANGLVPVSRFENNSFTLPGVRLEDLLKGVYPRDGDESWKANLRDVIAAWEDDGAPPPPS